MIFYFIFANLSEPIRRQTIGDAFVRDTSALSVDRPEISPD